LLSPDLAFALLPHPSDFLPKPFLGVNAARRVGEQHPACDQQFVDELNQG
jgi:hypothetical protein